MTQEAKPGNKVGVRYKGWLAKTNKIFDQTKGSKTFNFRVGVAPLCCNVISLLCGALCLYICMRALIRQMSSRRWPACLPTCHAYQVVACCSCTLAF